MIVVTVYPETLKLVLLLSKYLLTNTSLNCYSITILVLVTEHILEIYNGNGDSFSVFCYWCVEAELLLTQRLTLLRII